MCLYVLCIEIIYRVGVESNNYKCGTTCLTKNQILSNLNGRQCKYILTFEKYCWHISSIFYLITTGCVLKKRNQVTLCINPNNSDDIIYRLNKYLVWVKDRIASKLLLLFQPPYILCVSLDIYACFHQWYFHMHLIFLCYSTRIFAIMQSISV